MNAIFEKYLDTVDKCLKPLPTSERVDIVKEIKGSILEMESDNLSTEQILDRLGKPKDLAKAYLGDLLSKESGFSWNRFLTVCAFYSIVGFSGMIVIPCLAIIAPVFMVCGIASPISTGNKNDGLYFSSWPAFCRTDGCIYRYHRIKSYHGIWYSPCDWRVVISDGRASWKLLVYYCKSQ